MSSRQVPRSARDTRILQNLPLRRRCLFLSNRGFLHECFGAAQPESAARLRSTAALLQMHAKVLTTVPCGNESPASAVSEMLADVIAAEAQLTSSTNSSSSRSTTLAAREWTRWEDGVETLLCFLEDSDDDSKGPTPAQRETEAEAAVRQLLSALVIHLYDVGTAYFAVERQRSLAMQARKRQRGDDGEKKQVRASPTTTATTGDGESTAETNKVGDDEDADVDSTHDEFPMRLTWSIAAPISASVEALMRGE